MVKALNMEEYHLENKYLFTVRKYLYLSFDSNQKKRRKIVSHRSFEKESERVLNMRFHFECSIKIIIQTFSLPMLLIA